MNAELHNYDSFIDENPEIQERVAKGRAEGERQALQQMVLEAVKDQYPPLIELAQEQKERSHLSRKMIAGMCVCLGIVLLSG